MDVQPYVGVCHADVRSGSGGFAELVYYGVFHFVSHEFGVSELFGEYHRVHGKRFVVAEELSPVHLFHSFVNFVGSESLETSDRLEYSDSGVQLEVGSVKHFLVTCKRDHSPSNFHVVGTQMCEFLCQDGFKTHESLGNHFKFLFH